MRLGRHYESEARIERVLANARPAPSPEGPAHRARDLLAGCGLSEIVELGLRAAGPAGRDRRRRAARRRRRGQEPDLGRLRGDAHVAAARPGRCARPQPVARGSRTSACSRSARSSASAARPEAEPLQLEQVGILMTGRRAGWLKPGEPLDFFDLKRVVLARAAAASASSRRFLPARDAFRTFTRASARRARGGRRQAVWAAPASCTRCARTRLGHRAARVLRRARPRRAGRRRQRRAQRCPAAFSGGHARPLLLDRRRDLGGRAARAFWRPRASRCCADLPVREDFRDPKYAPAGKKGCSGA